MSAPDSQKPTDTAASEVAPRAPASHATSGWLNPALVLAAIALLAVMGVFWLTLERMQDMELQLARRIGEFDVAGREARAAAKDANAILGDLTTRLSALEARAQEAQRDRKSVV